MVYEIEKLHHGTPSGIDNTVVSMGRPILFRKGEPARFLTAPRTRGFLIVGHTGRRHRTSEIVADVARARGTDPVRYDAIFRDIGRLTGPGAEAFQAGRWGELGRLMDRNQELLEDLGVSSPELEALVRAAWSARPGPRACWAPNSAARAAAGAWRRSPTTPRAPSAPSAPSRRPGRPPPS
jgi:mevalonate kinase